MRNYHARRCRSERGRSEKGACTVGRPTHVKNLAPLYYYVRISASVFPHPKGSLLPKEQSDLPWAAFGPMLAPPRQNQGRSKMSRSGVYHRPYLFLTYQPFLKVGQAVVRDVPLVGQACVSGVGFP